MNMILNLKKAILEEYAKEQKKGTQLPKFVKQMCENIKTEVEESNPTFLLYYNEKKNIIGLKHNGKEYKAKCSEEDTFDKYIGASIVLGLDYYGGKKSFIKALGGVDYREYPSMALANAINRFGSKQAFEEYVDELFAKSRKPHNNYEIEAE